jgi:hypothetical protein
LIFCRVHQDNIEAVDARATHESHVASCRFRAATRDHEVRQQQFAFLCASLAQPSGYRESNRHPSALTQDCQDYAGQCEHDAQSPILANVGQNISRCDVKDWCGAQSTLTPEKLTPEKLTPEKLRSTGGTLPRIHGVSRVHASTSRSP